MTETFYHSDSPKSTFSKAFLEKYYFLDNSSPRVFWKIRWLMANKRAID